MTDERIEELADWLRKKVENLFLNPYDCDKGEPLPAELERHEIEAVVSEVERAFIKTLYLIEFKRQRAEQRAKETGQ